MNEYFQVERENPYGKLSDDLQQELELLIKKAAKGEMREIEFELFSRQLDLMTVHRARDHYVHRVSWALFTEEWIDYIARVFKDKVVLEVGAGRGILQAPMEKLGVKEWIATDAAPPEGCDRVLKLTAEEAAAYKDCDAYFASWIPYTEEWDCVLAAAGKPFVFVGEEGGCTGCERFWDEYGPQTGREYAGDTFPEIPSWYGIHDQTYFLHFED